MPYDLSSVLFFTYLFTYLFPLLSVLFIKTTLFFNPFTEKNFDVLKSLGDYMFTHKIGRFFIWTIIKGFKKKKFVIRSESMMYFVVKPFVTGLYNGTI